MMPYSTQYNIINRIGHARPTPSFGAPTLVWHLGIWPKRTADPQDTYGLTHEEARDRFIEKQRQWVHRINATLRKIQEHHRRSERIESFVLQEPADWELNGGGREPQGKAFKVFEHESLHFTVWWKDGSSGSDHGASERDALRVRVHAHMHEDYLTLSFYVDITKPWRESAHYHSSTAPGKLRRELMSHAENVKRICERRRMEAFAIDVELVPEKGVSPSEAEQLLEAADLLYDGAWQGFCKEFDVDLAKLAGGEGEIFANFRGLVLAAAAVPGLSFETDPDYITKRQAIAAPGTEPFELFDENGAEPNAVLKAYWPFIRRTTPFADYREYIACGVMKWRALYITAFGAEFTTDYADETASRSDDVPSGALPAGEETALTSVRHATEPARKDYGEAAGDEGKSGEDSARAPDPVRYLILTKGPPHRKQIGRVVGRVNAMGTMRLVALKDWSIIKDADAHIRMQGQELDRVTTQWSFDRDRIEESPPELHANIVQRMFTHDTGSSAEEKKYELISDLTKKVEAKLIKIAADLDKIGLGAIGGLHYRISRSTYYVQECSVLIDTLQIGHIHSWNSYNSFVKLGLQPAFDYISEAGNRLRGLRARLQSVTEAIQTSALVAQTTATRANTNALRAIARRYARSNMMMAALNFLLMLIAFLMGVSLARPSAGDVFERFNHYWDTIVHALHLGGA
jgi:hypothetical protein